MFPCLCRGIWLFLLSLWFFLLFIDKNNFTSSILPSFLRSSSEVTPSILHRYSIVSPSFRWTNDGVTMDKRWSMLEGKAEKQKSVELETPHSFMRALLSFVFTLLCFSFPLQELFRKPWDTFCALSFGCWSQIARLFPRECHSYVKALLADAEHDMFAVCSRIHRMMCLSLPWISLKSLLVTRPVHWQGFLVRNECRGRDDCRISSLLSSRQVPYGYKLYARLTHSFWYFHQYLPWCWYGRMCTCLG